MPDTTPPTLTSVSLQNADITDGGTTLTFSAGGTDVGSGVDHITLTFDHSWQGQNGLQNTITFSDLTDSFSDGVSALPVFFGSQSPAATYTVTSAQVFDHAGNVTTYTTTQLYQMGMQTQFFVINHNLAPTAVVDGPDYLAEDLNSTGQLTLTLQNVSQWTGNVTMSFYSPASTATNGQDVNVPTFSTTYQVNQPSGTYTINLPAFDILHDSTVDGTETVAILIHADGQVFATGTDTEVVQIALVDPGQTGGPGNDVLTGTQFDDQLRGFAGDDHLSGGAGNDFLDGGPGNDAIDGGDGNDRIVYDPADDPAHVTGGPGFDTLVVNDMPAPTSYNLAAGSFEQAEVNQHDTGNQYSWSTMTSLYDQSWNLTSVDLHNDNGTRTWITVDSNNSQPWAQEWFSYDPEGRLTSEDVRNDDGSHTWISVDANNSQPWTQEWFSYDAQGRLVSEDVRNDDGSHTFINIDATNSQNWSQDWFTYDAQGRLSSEDVRYDDGTHTFINIDENNSQPWAQDWFTYDAQGRLVSEDVRNDDGSHTFITLDANNSQAWSQEWFNYDAQGHLTSTSVVWDDGHVTYF